MHSPWFRLAGAALAHAWGEVKTGVYPIAGTYTNPQGLEKRQAGRPRADGDTSAYAVPWESYLSAIRTLCEGIWKDMVDVDARKYLAATLNEKFGTARSRDLVQWALAGGAPKNPPHWWLERRKWAPPKEK